MKRNKQIRIISSIIGGLILLFFPYFIYAETRMNLHKHATANLAKLPDNYEAYSRPEFIEEVKELKDNPNISIFKLASVSRKLDQLETGIDAYDYDDKYAKIYIFTADGKGERMRKEDGYKEAQLVFLDINNEKAVIDDLGKVKVRGNSTSEAEKLPYNIRFSHNEDLFGFGPAKKWCLLAECFDVTMLRNRMAFDLARQMGIKDVPECEFVKLYLDGIYKGAYLLTEAAEAGPQRIDIDMRKGDFMVEYELERNEEKSSYFTTEHEWRFLIREPENMDEATYNRISDRLDHYDEIITSYDFDQLQQNIDIDSFARIYLLNEMLKTIDFDYSSLKFYEKDRKFYAGPVWDFDLSSGNYSIFQYSGVWIGGDYDEKKQIGISYEATFCADRNPIFNTLLDIGEFSDIVSNCFDEYSELFQDLYADGGAIDRLLEKYGDLINSNYSPVEEGGAGWIVNKKYSSLEHERFPTYEEDIAYLKQWLIDRQKWLNENAYWH